jgi:hypothetical protein
MAAPKHNLYALGNNGGAPKKFETPELFDAKAKEYFDWCIENKHEISINGLALFMGFYDKTGLKNYIEYDEFLPYIKRALTTVELSYELDLRTFKFGGAVFALKNMGWTDVTTQNVNQTITNVEASFGTTLQTPQQSSEDTQLDKE